MEGGGPVTVGEFHHLGAAETVWLHLQDDLKVNQSSQTFWLKQQHEKMTPE